MSSMSRLLHLKDFLGAQEAGHEPVEQAPQLADAVLDRGAAEDQAMRCAHRLARLQTHPHSVPACQSCLPKLRMQGRHGRWSRTEVHRTATKHCWGLACAVCDLELRTVWPSSSTAYSQGRAEAHATSLRSVS
jgi:hypothetical protein